jgi:hypothetical protein
MAAVIDVALAIVMLSIWFFAGVGIGTLAVYLYDGYRKR